MELGRSFWILTRALYVFIDIFMRRTMDIWGQKGRGPVTADAKIRAKWQGGRECWKPPEAERGQKASHGKDPLTPQIFTLVFGVTQGCSRLLPAQCLRLLLAVLRGIQVSHIQSTALWAMIPVSISILFFCRVHSQWHYKQFSTGDRTQGLIYTKHVFYPLSYLPSLVIDISENVLFLFCCWIIYIGVGGLI